MHNSKIAVLITCHNRKDNTLSCLKHLFNCLLPASASLQVFLVDDGSTDKTGDAVKAKYPEIKIIKGSGQLYWNRGMHLAWISAKAHDDFDFYIWLNDDTVLKKNALIELLECQRLLPDETLVCGAISSADKNTFTYGGLDKQGSPVIPDGTVQSCYVINGNCVLISKKICDAIGLLDPVFPHAIGDHDYGLRAIANNFKVVTTREYIGFCERNASLPKWCYKETPLLKRIKHLYSPLGNSHPVYFFIYEKRHFGIGLALKHFFSIHLRAFVPTLWK